MKNILFLFLLLLSLSTVAQDCNIGNESSTGYTNQGDPIRKNYLLGVRFTLTTPGVLTSLNLIGRNTKALVKMALYADASHKPGNLIDSTKIDTVKTGVLSFPVTERVLAAGDYWIMAIYNTDGGHTYSKPKTGDTLYYQPMTFGTTIPSTGAGFLRYTNSTFTYFLGIRCGTTTAVAEPHTSSVINFYPNPASNQITIHTEPNLIGETYRITSIAGTQISIGQLTSEINTVDVNALQPGLYFMILGDRKQETIKFIKQ